ncbi:hypothetical protein SDC9_126923 [bioreactor metagenome]|uniref:Uncharacterized protein n=1 Tax=bioreactor metagenome TaxID=1076179 RepID=A0A645CSL3_9ZZZZ
MALSGVQTAMILNSLLSTFLLVVFRAIVTPVTFMYFVVSVSEFPELFVLLDFFVVVGEF